MSGGLLKKLACWVAVASSCVSWACTTKITVIEDDGSGDGGSGGSAVIPNDGPGQPPPPPPSGSPPIADDISFGASRVFYGGTDRSGSPNPSAWRSYGYNLDGLVSAAGNPSHCAPASGGKQAVMDDGDNGIDNAWGKQILPLWLSLANDFEEQANERIALGEYTLLFTVGGVGADANYLGLEARAYHGATLGAPPSFGGGESWPVTPESLDNPIALDSSKWSFLQSYVSNNTFVSSPRNGSFELVIPFDTFEGAMRLPLTNTVISMDLSPDRGTARNGIIAGIIPVEALVAEMRRIAGSFSQEFCSGTTIESLNDQLRQAADILVDGTQDPNRTCDGISLGVGFDAVSFAVNAIGTPTPSTPDPCGG